MTSGVVFPKAHVDHILGPAPDQALHPNHVGHNRWQDPEDGLDVLFRHRPHFLGLPGLGPPLLQGRQRPEPLIDPWFNQFLMHGPFEHLLDSGRVTVGRGSGLGQLQHHRFGLAFCTFGFFLPDFGHWVTGNRLSNQFQLLAGESAGGLVAAHPVEEDQAALDGLSLGGWLAILYVIGVCMDLVPHGQLPNA